jgi:DnaK suppressor protein
MTHKQHQRYQDQLLELRDRLNEAIARMSETVRTDARPAGEHDQHVSESSETELVLELDEETLRRQTVEALQRIDEGTFGKCQSCGGPVDENRLDAAPYTPFCIACARRLEKASRTSQPAV